MEGGGKSVKIWWKKEKKNKKVENREQQNKNLEIENADERKIKKTIQGKERIN